MPPRSATSEDILRNRVEITEEQARARHDQTARFQETLIHLEESMEKKIDKVLEEVKSLRNDMDRKYASKWTENVILWTMGAVGVAIIGALMSLILIKN